jgi:phospholipid/cholesterol/gamma-HCH transport system ATP-binding protein
MPSELSGGMRKRAGLARALVLDPGLLLLDEPTTGLDPIIAADIDELVLNIREAYGASMVVVAHDIESGLHIADRLVIFRDGKIVAQGTPQEIKNSQNPYVRQFLQRRPNKPQERPPLFHKQTGIVKT